MKDGRNETRIRSCGGKKDGPVTRKQEDKQWPALGNTVMEPLSP